MDNKLKGKDLINIGIFAAIYFVINMVLSFMGFVPILLLLMVVITPIVGGTPFMLFLTKVKKFGMITIFAFIIGLLMMLTGMGFYAIFTSLVFGLAADFIAKNLSCYCGILMLGLGELSAYFHRERSLCGTICRKRNGGIC